jgi:hypothetical protein
MMTDGINGVEGGEAVKVMDIAEVLLNRHKTNGAAERQLL